MRKLYHIYKTFTIISDIRTKFLLCLISPQNLKMVNFPGCIFASRIDAKQMNSLGKKIYVGIIINKK